MKAIPAWATRWPGNLTGPLSLVIASAVQMVLGELVPKNASIARPFQVAAVAGPFQTGFSTAFRPIITFLNRSANFFVRRLGIEPEDELGSARSAEELMWLVRHSATEGALPPGTAQVLHRAAAVRRQARRRSDDAAHRRGVPAVRRHRRRPHGSGLGTAGTAGSRSAATSSTKRTASRWSTTPSPSRPRAAPPHRSSRSPGPPCWCRPR
ncbi:CNNM domain-containing protein [Yinghuangia aomiensis]